MLKRAMTYLIPALCTVGLLAANVAVADDHRHRSGHRYERSYDSPHRHADRNDRGYARRHHRVHDARRDWRAPAHYSGRRLNHDRHCNDRRHFHRAHVHVPARYYHRDSYPRHAYHGLHRHGGEATVILSFPF